MRNLTKTIAAVSLLMPVSAYPLGIGDIKLHSALNQKLDAEIALLVSADEDVSDIKVKLASPDKFDKAGVPWSYFLSKIKFKAVTLADGKTVVKLSSNEALREPFLDFLLEVTWATGNLYREFTVLVDPPATYSSPTLPVIEKPQQVSPSYIASKPIETKRAHVDTFYRTTDGQYGPTNRYDSMWKVAEKVNVYDDVSIEQMMMAIYEANPRAFYKKNVNALMAGKTLNIPEKSVILQMSRKQARAAFKEQDNVWRGKVSQKSTQEVVDNTKLASQLELEAPVVDQIGESVNVVSDDVTTKHIVDSQIDDSKIASSDEGLALQARMDKLEQQLVMMQKILILKDEKIATLQNRKSDKTETITTESPKTVVTQKPVEIVKKLAETTPVKPVATPVEHKKETVPPKSVVKPTPVVQPKPVVEESSDYLSLAIGGGSIAILGLLGLLWWRKRNVEEDTETDSMFASASEISLPDSPEDELSIPIADDSSLYDVGTVGESSFLSEFTPSDFDAFDTDQSEVDPIAEADVYLAYGRYQQAEDLMQQAIKDYPERDECKLKLLEVFYTNENKAAFETYVKELVAEGKHENTEFWGKVVEMGHELDPDLSLYDDKASFETVNLDKEKSIETEPEQVSMINESSLNDKSEENIADFDLSVFEGAETADEAETIIAKEIEPEAEITADDNVLDFDLSVFDIDSSDENTQVVETKNVEAEEIETMDFDLDSFSLNDAEPQSEETKPVEPSDDIESFEFDLGSETDESESEDGVVNLTSDMEDDIDLESFDFSEPEIVEDKIELNTASVEPKSEIDDFEFDFDEPAVPELPTATSEVDAGVSDLTDMDELETKLDLAKAYIDMGDADAAKDIAVEVLEKGSDEQKIAAQEVLDQLK